MQDANDHSQATLGISGHTPRFGKNHKGATLELDSPVEALWSSQRRARTWVMTRIAKWNHNGRLPLFGCFFFVCFYCYFCVVVIVFPCCLFLFLLFLLLLMLLLLLFVAMLGASWCLVLVVMLVIMAISRQDGKTVKLFDLRQWLMKEKVGTSCHPTWCLLKYFGLPKCPKRHPF